MVHGPRSSSPRRSPTAGSTSCAPPATRSTSGSGCRPRSCSRPSPGAARAHHPLGHPGHRRGAGGGRPTCMVVGRAGIGLDNVDVDAATRRGVMVVNAPQSNILSAAEHTMALLLAQARNVPQAHAALKAGPVGAVAVGGRRAATARRSASSASAASASWWPSGRWPSACASWPTTPSCRAERARQMGVELLAARAGRGRGRLPHHPPAQDHGDGRPDRQGAAGPGQARAAGRSTWPGAASSTRRPWPRPSGRGRSAGAALDVFANEPTTESPLFELDSVVVTPHLGASTREAQDKAGDTIAEQVQLALAGEFVPFAVNVDAGRGVGDGAAVPRRWPSAWAGCSRSLAEGVPSTARGRVRGPARRLRHPHPHAVGAEGPVRRRAATSR